MFWRFSKRKGAKLRVSGHLYTEQAAHRATFDDNEDALSLSAHPGDETVLICLLADGAGGQPGGKEAAQTAIVTCREGIHACRSTDLWRSRFWMNLLQQADKKIASVPSAGFTTLIALAIGQTQIRGASCGDSAALLTKTDGAFIVLTENQRKHPPLGSGFAIPTEFMAAVAAEDRLVICSDGVYRYVGMEAIAETVQNCPDISAVPPRLRAQQTASSAGRLSDDFSVILVEINWDIEEQDGSESDPEK